MATNWSKYREEPNIDWSQYKEGVSSKPASSTWGSLYKGITESFPSTLKSGVNALAEPFGGQPFEEQPEQPTTNWPEYLGRLTGKAGGYGLLAAPIAGAAQAAIPGLLGASIGSGLAGGALTKGGIRERLTDALLSSALPGIAKGAGAALRIGKSALSSVKPRHAADIIQSEHDLAHAAAVEPLKFASKQAKERGISSVPINKSVIKASKDVLPKTRSYRDLINKAKSGDYDALRELSSDLGSHARSLEKADTHADRNLGKLAEEARQDVNQSIYKHFNDTGHKDLAESIQEGMHKYKNYMELFHKNKTISQLVGKEKVVPENLIHQVGKDTAYHQKLREAIPELNKVLKKQKDRELLNKLGKHIGYKAGAAAAVKSLIPGYEEK